MTPPFIIKVGSVLPKGIHKCTCIHACILDGTTKSYCKLPKQYTTQGRCCVLPKVKPRTKSVSSRENNVQDHCIQSQVKDQSSVLHVLSVDIEGQSTCSTPLQVRAEGLPNPEHVYRDVGFQI